MGEADGYNYQVVEASKQHARELEQKDAVVRDCRTYIDSLTDQVNARSEELSSLKVLAAQLEAGREEAEAMQAEKMTECNKQVTELRQDLNKRNEQVLGFVQKLKEIKRSMKQKGRSTTPITDLDTDYGSTESLDWDYEGILEHSAEFIQRLVGETEDVPD